MGMMADNQIGTVVDGKLGQGHLIGIGNRIFFISPVEDHKDQIGAFCPYLLDIYPNLMFPFQVIMELVNAYQSDLDALDLHKSRLVITESGDPSFFQVFLCVSKSLVTIIVAVVVCHIDSLHTAVCEDFCIFRRSFEGESFSVSCGGVRESSLKVDDRQVIRIKNRLHILEKISRTVHIVIGVQAGAVIKSFVFSKGAVSGHTYRDRDRFLETLRFTFLHAGVFRFQRFRLIVGNCFCIIISGKSTEKQEDQEDQDGGTGGTEDQKHLFFLFRLAQLQKKFSVFRSIHVISFLFEAFS